LDSQHDPKPGQVTPIEAAIGAWMLFYSAAEEGIERRRTRTLRTQIRGLFRAAAVPSLTRERGADATASGDAEVSGVARGWESGKSFAESSHLTGAAARLRTERAGPRMRAG